MFESIIAWIVANVDGILAVLFAIHAAAVAVVNLTPTPADDAVVAKVYRFIEFLAGIVSVKAKAIPGEDVDQLKATVAEVRAAAKAV